MGKNNFVTFLAAGVIILAYTIIFGFPEENKAKRMQTKVQSEIVEPIPIDNIYTGTWINRDWVRDGTGKKLSEYLYRFDLKQEGNKLTGDHCFSIDNARKIDCGDGNKRQTVDGVLDGNRAIISLTSSFAKFDLSGTLKVEGDKLFFEAIETDDIVPPKIEFTKVIESKELVGIWQDYPMMWSGWSDHYNFYGDGVFWHYQNSMECKTVKTNQKGTWKLDGDILTITTTENFVDRFKKCDDTGLSDYLSTNRVVLKKPIVEQIYLTKLPFNESDIYEGVKMERMGANSATYWKFDDDPAGGGEFAQ